MSELTPQHKKLIEIRMSERLATTADSRSEPDNGARESARTELSSTQTRLLFMDRLTPCSPAYNADYMYRLSGPLDIEALRRALDEIRARHEVLRTTFQDLDGSPRQSVAPWEPLDIPLEDWSGRPQAEASADAFRLLREKATEPFDLASGPLLRVHLIRLAEDLHQLILVFHHIVIDGWSMRVFWRELAELYGAFSRGEPSPLRPLRHQYADYAAWQNAWLAEPAAARQLEFWRETLRDAPLHVDLPTDRPRPARLSGRGGRVDFRIPAQVTERLRRLGQERGASMFMVLLAGFDVLLSRYSGQTDVVTGSPIAGRQDPRWDDLIGLFVNQLPIRVRWSGDPRFTELLDLVRDASFDAYANQDIPFERVVEDLSPERDVSRNPVFQVSFDAGREDESGSEEVTRLPGLRVSIVAFEMSTTRFDLEMRVAVDGDELAGSLLFSPSLYDSATATRIARHFANLLADIAEHPDAPLSRLRMLSADEWHELVVAYNRTAMAVPSSTVAALLSEQAGRTPDSPAVVFQGMALTYRELNARVNRLAHHLIAQGIGAEDFVAVALPRSLDTIVALTAILKAGAAFLPIDLAHPAERIGYLIADAGCRAVVTTEQAAKGLPDGTALVLIDQLDLSGCPEHDPTDADRVRPLHPENAAYLLYTSGSTGQPKGVVVAHANAVNFCHWASAHFGFDRLRRVLVSTSFSFDASLFEWLVPLTVGGEIEIVRDLLEIAERGGWTGSMVTGVPSGMSTLLSGGGLELNVDGLVVGGEALPPPC